MSFSNERGQYGFRPRIGAEAPTPAGASSKLPLVLGVVGLAAVGLVVLGARAKQQQQPRLTAHEKEVRAWETSSLGCLGTRIRSGTRVSSTCGSAREITGRERASRHVDQER